MIDFAMEHGDCLEAMEFMPDNSIDSIVTDPPYGLSFMGKQWDHGVPGVGFWREMFRVLKPGGHLLAFGGTRTYHRMACAIEDAEFELRDSILWLYGSGFPKSKNLAGEMQGWGTALKPAYEPIVMARKPLIGTVESNVLVYGTGALNIDGCRVRTDDVIHVPQSDPAKRAGVVGADLGISSASKAAFQGAQRASIERTMTLGRWPANVIHDGSEEVLAAFPDAKGQQGDLKAHAKCRQSPNGIFGGMRPALDHAARIETETSAARFFYCAKAAKKDRGEGNTHPTVKPTELMRYLCRLVTPVSGTVLDPFAGSGSTGKAAALEGFNFIGIEREAEYFAIAEARVRAAYDSTLACVDD